MEELQRIKIVLDIEKLRGEIRQQAKVDQRELIRLMLAAAAAGAALMGAAVALVKGLS